METNLNLNRFIKIWALSLALLFSWSVKAAEKNGEKCFSSSLKFTITHGQPIDLNSNVTFTVAIPENAELKSAMLKNNSKQVALETTGRTKTRGDGKIDVDIIIKMQFFNDFFHFQPYNIPNKPFGYKQIIEGLDLILITVDNISGVFANSPNTPGDVRIAFDSELNPNNNGSHLIEIASGLVREVSEIPTSQINSRIVDFTVFPTPSFNNEVNIRIPEDVKVTSVVILNSIGAVINTDVINGSAQLLEIKLNTEQKGIYFARLQTNKGEYVKKIILR